MILRIVHTEGPQLTSLIGLDSIAMGCSRTSVNACPARQAVKK